ncbi:MAG: hypothetical protein G3M78_15335 [Candidatus Nitrohelix vancouverensis]|uniref:Uncharacterized protein n=1 Tax=Candidatus Nitrohelix vancouverensis TaxID=2705534 RepID=A0A7T0C568_9BACT|nr:MAG: hypothetical protein G3M78_15335 [Candidatus Nitrohelix vancouverensis]
MEISSIEDDPNEKNRKLYSRISFWGSILLSTAAVVWYSMATPPDTPEVQKMRMFFKENIIEVSTFINLPRDEMEAFAKKKKHPFYANYLKKGLNEQNKLKALIHISTDYTPYQYWFNMIFLWTICFTTLWFVFVMMEGALVILRKEGEKRRAEIARNKKLGK